MSWVLQGRGGGSSMWSNGSPYICFFARAWFVVYDSQYMISLCVWVGVCVSVCVSVCVYVCVFVVPVVVLLFFCLCPIPKLKLDLTR